MIWWSPHLWKPSDIVVLCWCLFHVSSRVIYCTPVESHKPLSSRQSSGPRLWDSNGASFLVRSLAQESTQVPALEALVGWFGVKDRRLHWV